MSTPKRGCVRPLMIAVLAAGGLCLLLVAVVQVINTRQPTGSTTIERLSAADKARLAEVFHLRQALGDQVLPGWSQVVIPVIVYNEQYLFLVGLADPASGWKKIPQGTQMGQAWEPVPADDFYGQPYYRQKIPASGATTQAFTVQVGDAWAASLATLEWSRISMAAQMREELPGPLKALVPFPLVVSLLVPDSDLYITLIEHEAVHAYQGIRAPERLAAAERAGLSLEKQYPWEDSAFRDAWQAELDLLNEALRAASAEETLRLTRAFLQQREQRRAAAGLSDDLIEYERQREWEEGIAKYGERQIYLLAGQGDYQPATETRQDPEFHNYQGGQQKWDQEVDQMRRMAGAEGDGRFYYSGFAQAVLLDRLAPGWKERLFAEGVWLEDLLAEAAR